MNVTEYTYFILGIFLNDIEDIFAEYENDDPDEVRTGWYSGAYSLDYIYNELIKNKKKVEDELECKHMLGYKKPHYDREARNYSIQAFVEDYENKYPKTENFFTVAITVPENKITLDDLKEFRHKISKEWEKLAIKKQELK